MIKYNELVFGEDLCCWIILSRMVLVIDLYIYKEKVGFRKEKLCVD